MNGIWGIKELSKEAVVNKEVLVTMRKRAQAKEKYQDGTFAMGNTGFGYWLTDAKDGFSSNHFPSRNEDSTVYAVSAGTIYNCSELKIDLEKNGHKFHSATDAEMVVHLYEELGEDFAAKLYGNFVIALWDKTKRSLILSRDQLGVKPLYYTVVNNKLIYASEIKLILAHPDVRAQVDTFALSEYFSFEYVPGPKTIYAGINKLLPAQLLICKDEKIELKKYWQIHYQESGLNEDEICRQIIARLKESIKYCLGGNKQKGVLLSGGIDSSTLVALMRDLGCENINTFSAIFKEKAFNESSNASLVAKYFNTKHHQILIEPKGILNSLAEINWQFDEPLADASVMPTYLVAHLARKEGMDICISGDGGDELFGGYDAYAALHFLKHVSKLPPLLKSTFNRIVDLLSSYNYRGVNFKIKKFKEGINLPPELAYYTWWGAYSSREQKKLFTEEINNALGTYDSFRVIYQYLQECSGWELLNKVFYMDLKFNLPDGSLRKSERVATINSLEGRPPFLYPSLVELSSSIPHNLKLRGLTTKYIFKKSIKPYLPAKIINVPKRGFDIPLEDWIRKDLRDFVIDSLSENIIKKQGFLDYAYIQRLLKEHFDGKINHRQKIWPIVVFTCWYRAAFD